MVGSYVFLRTMKFSELCCVSIFLGIVTDLPGISNGQPMGVCDTVNGCREQTYLSEAKDQIFRLADSVVEEKVNEKLRTYEERIKTLEQEIRDLRNPRPSSTRIGTEGKEFIFVFPPLFYDSDDAYVAVYISAQDSGLCNISVPLQYFQHPVVFHGGSKAVTFPKSLMADENMVQDRGVHVKCTVDISFYALKADRFSRTMFLVLPVEMYTGNYFVPSVQPLPVQTLNSYNSTISVVSAHDNNLIAFHLNMSDGEIYYLDQTYRNFDIMSIVLNKYESFVLSHGHDLTGTRVTSTEPISVGSGNNCGRLHSDHACSGMQIMLPSSNTFQKKFILPVLKTHDQGFTVRVSTPAHMTRVKLQFSESERFVYLPRGGYHDIKVSDNDTLYVESNNDVIATLMTPGKNNTNQVGTAFMLYIASLEQYKREYHFSVPDAGLISHATFIAKNISNIKLDGVELSFDASDIAKTVLTPNGTYDMATVSISLGYHFATDTNDDGFGLYVYGKMEPSLGYGFCAGFDVDLPN